MNKRLGRFVSLQQPTVVDGKLKASFFTYQRLCENSLATWWRNVFLMTNVSVNIDKLDTEDTFASLLLLGSNIMLLWSAISYYLNINAIVESAAEKDVKINANWSWLIFGITFWILHVYYTVRTFM